MTDQSKKASKKTWQEPRVDAVANVRETRGGFSTPKAEAGVVYAS